MQPEAQKKVGGYREKAGFRAGGFLSALPTPHPVVLSRGPDLSHALPIWRLIVFRRDTTTTACKQAKSPGSPESFLNKSAQTLQQNWRDHSSVVARLRQQHGKWHLLVINSSNWRRKRVPGATFDSGRVHRISLNDYRPPQAGQPPASKVSSRHCLRALLGA